MALKSIDLISKEFISLSKKSKLNKFERNKARQLMAGLKQAGLSNEQISELSGGKWSPNSIKSYAKGVQSAQTQSENLVQLLQGLNANGLTLADVETTVAIVKQLKSHNVTLDGVIDILLAAESQSTEIADLVQYYQKCEQCALSLEKISEVLEAKKNFEAKEISFDSLIPLSEATKKYGDPPAVLEAITVYGSLLDMKEHVKAAGERLEIIKVAKSDQEIQIDKGKKEMESLAASMEAYREVKELGFDKESLSNLAEISLKFGGPKAVIQAFKTYGSYQEINKDLVEAQNELFDLKSEIAKRQSEHSNLNTAIDMCLKLINEYHVGLDGIEILLSTAIKYGDPLKVLEAIVAYSKIQALLEEVDKRQGIIDVSKQKIAHLDAEYETSLGKLQSLNALALQVGGELNKVHAQAENHMWISQLLKLINAPYDADYGTHINAAMVLGRALKAFVTKNEPNFRHYSRINDGLGLMIADLGGVNDITG